VSGVEAAKLIASGAAELAVKEAAELAAVLVEVQARPFGGPESFADRIRARCRQPNRQGAAKLIAPGAAKLIARDAAGP
jgi:hypothetical protein